jgi:dTDP-4-dehydrorhamnose reductase
VRSPPRILLTGGEGRLGRVASAGLAAGGWDVTALGHRALDITDRALVRESIEAVRPDAVLNLAAQVDVGLCERDPAAAHRVNVLGVRHVAEACRLVGAHLCHVSSDYVFGGSGDHRPYVEDDAVAPLSVYGRTKRAGEIEAGEDATCVRTAWLSSAFGPNIVRSVLAQAADPQRELRYVDDQRGSPTVSDDLVGVLAVLVEERVPGIFHVTNQGSASWFEVARHVLAVAGEDPARITPTTGEAVEPLMSTLRPHYSVLDNAALRAAGIPLLPRWERAFADLVERLTAPPRRAVSLSGP